MTTISQAVADAYIRATNDHDATSFLALFDEGAVVDDAGREFRGMAAIRSWSGREIFDAKVTLQVINIAEGGGETILTTKVEGNFDRKGLPDPVIIDHHLKVAGDKILSLKCRLAV